MQTNDRANVRGFLGYELFWGLGMPFVLAATVLPGYLKAIGAPLALIAVAPQMFFLTGFAAEPFTHKWPAWRPRRLRPVLLLAFAYGGFYLALAALIASGRLVAGGRATLWLSVGFILAGAMAMSMCSSLYYGMMMELIPRPWQGRVVGVRQVILALTGIAGAWLSARLLGAPGLRGYARCFAMAGGLFIAATALLGMTIAEPAVPRRDDQRAGGFWAQFRHLARLPLYRRWMLAHLAAIAGMSGVGLLTVYQQDRLGGGNRLIGYFTLTFMIARIVCGPAVGLLADRRGYKAPALLHRLVIIAAFVVSIVGGGRYMAFAVFAFLGMGHSLLEMWFANYLTELLPAENRVQLISGGKMLSSPVAVAAALLLARLIDCGWSYPNVFAIAAALATLSALIIAIGLPEPRRRAGE